MSMDWKGHINVVLGLGVLLPVFVGDVGKHTATGVATTTGTAVAATATATASAAATAIAAATASATAAAATAHATGPLLVEQHLRDCKEQHHGLSHRLQHLLASLLGLALCGQSSR